MQGIEFYRRNILGITQLFGIKQHYQIGTDKVVAELSLFQSPNIDIDLNINETTPLEFSEKYGIYLKREDLFMTANNEETKMILSRFSKPRGIENLIKNSKAKTFVTFDTKVSKAGVGIANIINKHIENQNQVICVVNIMLSQIVSAIKSKDEEQVKTVSYALDNMMRILIQKNTRLFIVAKYKNAVNLIDGVFGSFCEEIKRSLFKEAVILPKGLRTAEAVYGNFKQAKKLYEEQIEDKSKPINIFDTAGSLTIGSGIAIYFFNEYLKGNKTNVKIRFVGCGMNTAKKLDRIRKNIDLYNELAEEKIKKDLKTEKLFKDRLKESIIVCDDVYNGKYFKLLDQLINLGGNKYIYLNRVYEAKGFANMMIHIERNNLKENTNIFRLVGSEDIV